MTRVQVLLAGLVTMAVSSFGVCTSALATPITPCLNVSSCTVNSITYTETGITVPAGSGFSFLATFDAGNQSNATISTDVLAFLVALGDTGVDYLGRQNGTGAVGGDLVSTTTSDGGFTGNWTLSPGTTGDVGAFSAIHAGDGHTVEIFQVDNPGLTGKWATLNGHNLSNFDLFGTDPPPATGVPEPLTLALFGAGLLGVGAIRGRKAKA